MDAAGAEGFTEVADTIDPSQATENKIQADILATDASLARLEGISTDFDPQYLTFLNQIHMKALSGKERLSLPLSPENKAKLEEFTTFKVSYHPEPEPLHP